MRNRNLVVFMIASATILSSCATIVAGSSKSVTFDSNPNGVELVMDGNSLGVTPLTIQITGKPNRMIVARKEGYEAQSIILSTKRNPWFWGNIIILGVYGSTTDVQSGAAFEYEPNNYFITLMPKKVSEGEQIYLEKKMWARNFILGGYWYLAGDIARSEGEHLSSLYTILGIETHAREGTLRNLGYLLSRSHSIPVFAETIVDQYFLPQSSIDRFE